MRKLALIFFIIPLLLSCDTFLKFEGDIEIIKPHPTYAIEWWYQTGVLNGGDYSYELTIFRTIPNKWLLHAVVHDHTKDKRIFIEKILDPSKLVIDSETNMVYSDDEILLQIVWSGDIKVKFECDDFAFDFTLKPKKGWVDHGVDGIVDMGFGKSYYYSLTNVDLSGKLRIGSSSIDVVGKTWMDKQWGNFTARPWDWFSFRLDGDYEIMVFSFPQDGLSYGTLILPDRSVKRLEKVKIELSGSYEFDGKIVPIPPAEVKIDDLNAVLEALPVSKDQFNPSKYTPSYWEGLCRVNGTLFGRNVRGWAFFEGWR